MNDVRLETEYIVFILENKMCHGIIMVMICAVHGMGLFKHTKNK